MRSDRGTVEEQPMMNDTERELWNYIDGTCTPQERKAAEDRIGSDPVVAELYRELLAVDAALAGLEPEHPSMGFTRKVMEAVREGDRPVPVTIDKRLVIGIAAFFGTVFLVFFCVLLFSADRTAEPAYFRTELSVPPAVYRTVFSPNYLVAFLMADVVLALYILDGFFRKRLLSKKL